MNFFMAGKSVAYEKAEMGYNFKLKYEFSFENRNESVLRSN